MNKKIKVGILTLMVFLTVGCTKYVKDDDKRQVINETTGQTLTSNILCKPTTDDLLAVYKKYDDNGMWKFDVGKSMKAVGIDIDLNKIK